MTVKQLQQKPDPSIKKNVLHARAELHKKKDTRALVAGTSVAAVLGAWALFAGVTARPADSAQATATNTTVTAITTVTATPSAGTQDTGGLDFSWLASLWPFNDQSSTQTNAGQDTTTSTSSTQFIANTTSAQLPITVARTRSSQ